MAAKQLKVYSLVLIIFLAGITVAGVIESRLSLCREKNRQKFIAAYLDLAIARERYTDADSLSRAIDRIYSAHGVDSAWMAAYAAKMSGDLNRSGLIWEAIVGKLDSLRQVNKPDSLTNPLQP